MSFRKFILGIMPNWVVLIGADLRCRWRCSIYSRNIPYQPLGREPAIIVAPHPDDETFGCGGLIKLKRAAGVPLRVVLLTDGEAVGSGVGELAETVITARKREFTEACHRLGLDIGDLRWLHLPDGKLPQSGQSGFEAAVRLLAAEIKSFSPGEVYCTHPQDVRPDHIAAVHITQAALGLLSKPCTLFFYPIWMWYHASSGLRRRLDITGAWRLDISAALNAKKHAMDAYLNAPKTGAGNPYCGRLPSSFLKNFRQPYEVYFPASGAIGQS